MLQELLCFTMTYAGIYKSLMREELFISYHFYLSSNLFFIPKAGTAVQFKFKRLD